MSLIDARKPRQLTINGKTFKARVYAVNGREIELYKVQAFVMAINKTHKTFLKWESLKQVPGVLFTVKNAGNCKRWFSREQILNIAKVFQLYPLRQGKPEFKEAFFRAYRAVFYSQQEMTTAEIEEKIKEVAHALRFQKPDGEVRSGSHRPESVAGTPSEAAGRTSSPSGSDSSSGTPVERYRPDLAAINRRNALRLPVSVSK